MLERAKIIISFLSGKRNDDVMLSAADSGVIKTFVRLEGINAKTSYEKDNDNDLQELDLSHIIPCSRTKVTYFKQMYLPLQYLIGESLAQNNRSGVNGL